MIILTAVVAVVLVVGLIVVGGLFRGGDSKDLEITTQREGRRLGSPTAGIVLSMWEDFQCPWCKRTNDAIVSRVIQDYVETGKVQLLFRHFAFIGQESVWAAEASECAAEQNRFWDYEQELFKRQAGENVGTYRKDRLKAYAQNIGLDTQSFGQCLDTDKYKSAVESELAEGKRLGVNSTPTFILEGRVLSDKVNGDYGLLQAEIERLLKTQ